ncbi:MAG: cob(I)yrinic acid a,c-diamide adenosyltransferase [Synergistaceae bacterium]|nr:cob(I)yrinic acid a,c-diamide adenosyltransferase [Synergistaceae bacterium]
MANLYTKTGDKGTTGLVGGSRVSKADGRVECYGTIDEAGSMLGLAYSQSSTAYVRESVRAIQGRLFALAAELASDEKGLEKLRDRIGEADISFLEGIVDKCTETTGPQRSFVIPGVNPASAALHVARTIVRRAERAITRCNENMRPGAVFFRDELLRYVNRLSDAVYALARYEETLASERELRLKVEELVKKEMQKKFSGGDEPFTLENMKRMAEAAEKKAKEMGVPIVFAAVDMGGNPVLLHRMEGSLLASIDIALNKAYTAASLKMSTDALGKISRPGEFLYGVQNTNQNRIVIFGGGFPYKYKGEIVGAIGVSGGTVDEDMEIAVSALNYRTGGNDQ